MSTELRDQTYFCRRCSLSSLFSSGYGGGYGYYVMTPPEPLPEVLVDAALRPPPEEPLLEKLGLRLLPGPSGKRTPRSQKLHQRRGDR